MDYVIGEKLRIEDVQANHIDLSSSILSETTMTKVNLTGSTAHELSMPNSTITSCKLNEMEANAINMQQTNLKDSEIIDSNLAFLDFSGDESKIIGCKIANTNLTKFQAASATISQSNFDNVKATGVNLSNAKIIQGTQISNCDLDNAKMDNVSIKNAGISKTDLTGSHLQNSEIIDSNIVNCKLQAMGLCKYCNTVSRYVCQPKYFQYQ
jgi:uncharacterized protein YjbI with pentapeptide repeats